MWNRPQLMIAVSDLLFVAGAASLLVAATIWSARLPFFPLREIVFQNELRELRVADIERSLAGRLRGNFFSVDLNGLRRTLEGLPWVRHAEVYRRWPGKIEVNIEEHRPVAFWGTSGSQLVNSYGEVFFVDTDESDESDGSEGSKLQKSHLPVLTGPIGMAQEMLGYFHQAEALLAPIRRQPKALDVSPRLALRLTLDDGMVVELGREQDKAPIQQRLERFVEHYPSVLAAAGRRPEVVDMRYPSGFALRVGAPRVTESKGRP